VVKLLRVDKEGVPTIVQKIRLDSASSFFVFTLLSGSVRYMEAQEVRGIHFFSKITDEHFWDAEKVFLERYYECVT
jgi:hypothetical protein